MGGRCELASRLCPLPQPQPGQIRPLRMKLWHMNTLDPMEKRELYVRSDAEVKPC